MPPLVPGQTLVHPGVGTLQAAANAANDGDVLVLADGVYTGQGENVLEVSKSITIRALNPHRALLDGQNTRRVVVVMNSVTTSTCTPNWWSNVEYDGTYAGAKAFCAANHGRLWGMVSSISDFMGISAYNQAEAEAATTTN